MEKIWQVLRRHLGPAAVSHSELVAIQARAEGVHAQLRDEWRKSFRKSGVELGSCKPILVVGGGIAHGLCFPHSDVDLGVFYYGRCSNERSIRSLRSCLGRFNDGLSARRLNFRAHVYDLDTAFDLAIREYEFFTFLMESRFVAGNSWTARVLNELLWGDFVRRMKVRYLISRIHDLVGRRKIFGGAERDRCNLKYGCGGMRDVQDMVWSCMVVFGTNDLGVLVDKGFISPNELRVFLDAYVFLLRVREWLHNVSTAPGDFLSVELESRISEKISAEWGLSCRDFRSELLEGMSRISRIVWKTVLKLVLVSIGSVAWGGRRSIS